MNGPAASPVYTFLKASAGQPADVEWNFGKFLVGADGKVLKRYAPTVPPAKLAADIEAL